MPVGPTAKMAVPRPESFSTVRWCTGLTSDERIPILETKNSSMTSVRVRSTFAQWIELMDEPVTNCARLRSI